MLRRGLPRLYRFLTSSPTRALGSSNGMSGGGPLAAYKAKVKKGLIEEDFYQLEALEQLQRLYTDIMSNPQGPKIIEHQVVQEGSSSSSSWTDFFGPSKSSINMIKRAVPTSSTGKVTNGIYLWGGPGCGKTFMMDMLFESLDIERKQRVHFNDFMITVHKRYMP